MKSTHLAFPCLLLAAALFAGQSGSQPKTFDPNHGSADPLEAASSESAESASDDTPSPQQSSPEPSGTSTTASHPQPSNVNRAGQNPPEKQQPKRILGVMPNFRAVSAGALPPPPPPKQAFVIATQNSFDYSSFIFVGGRTLLRKGEGWFLETRHLCRLAHRNHTKLSGAGQVG